MYSIKPGRGPSLMGAIGGVAVAVVGVGWTLMAVRMGAPVFFALFGVVFVFLALVGVIYNLFNATQKNRMSAFDVTSDDDEPDPIATAMGHAPDQAATRPAGHAAVDAELDTSSAARFCPTCGAPLIGGEDHCPYCGTRF
jgi:hypothetical protein